MIKVGMIGLGAWAQLWLKKIQASTTYECVGVYSRSRHAEVDLGKTRVAESVDDILDDPTVDVVFVMTPVIAHFDIVMRALKNDKHVFVTKPVALSTDELSKMRDLSISKNKFFVVDHTFMHSPDYLKLKSLTSSIGALESIYSLRCQWGKFQHQSDVFMELCYHDIYLAMDLAEGAQLIRVDRRAYSRLNLRSAAKSVFDSGTIYLEFDSGLSCVLNASQCHLQKQRSFNLVGSKGLIEWDLDKSVQLSLFSGRFPDIRTDQMMQIASGKGADAMENLLHEMHELLHNRPSQAKTIGEAIRVHEVLELASRFS